MADKPSAGEVVGLRPLKAEPVAAVVALAEETLARAKAGDLIALGVVGVHLGRADSTAFTLGEGSVAGLALGCERLKARLLAEGE